MENDDGTGERRALCVRGRERESYER